MTIREHFAAIEHQRRSHRQRWRPARDKLTAREQGRRPWPRLMPYFHDHATGADEVARPQQRRRREADA